MVVTDIVHSKQFLLYKTLLKFIALKYKIPDAPTVHDEYFDEKQKKAIMQWRKKLIANPKEEILSFCKDNPYGLTDDEIVTVWWWINLKEVSGYLMQHKKMYSLLMDDDDAKVYALQWINDPISEMIPSEVLPHMIETVLLPFQWWIIRDGWVVSQNIYFSTTVKKELMQTMQSIIMTTWVTMYLWEDEDPINTAEQKKLDALVWKMKEDPERFKKDIKQLVQSSDLCKTYYIKQSAKKYQTKYKQDAALLWLTGYVVVLYANCVCGIGKDKKEAMAVASSLFPELKEEDVVVIKV